MILNYYRHRLNAFRDAYDYYLHFDERSDYGYGGGGGGGYQEEYCCGNEALDQELTQRVLLIVLLVAIIFFLFYLFLIQALNGSSGRRLGNKRLGLRLKQSITDDSPPSSAGQYPFFVHFMVVLNKSHVLRGSRLSTALLYQTSVSWPSSLSWRWSYSQLLMEVYKTTVWIQRLNVCVST